MQLKFAQAPWVPCEHRGQGGRGHWGQTTNELKPLPAVHSLGSLSTEHTYLFHLLATFIEYYLPLRILILGRNFFGIQLVLTHLVFVLWGILFFIFK